MLAVAFHEPNGGFKVWFVSFGFRPRFLEQNGSINRMARASVLVDLALQGGGSHGAFTWGVLDRLLEESWLRIDGISGTSAGAMNAVVLVDGYDKGGAQGRAAALEKFWRRVSYCARV